jgi:hypothetical protein
VYTTCLGGIIYIQVKQRGEQDRTLPFSSLHGFLYRQRLIMENVCRHGNVLTEPLASNGLVRCARR